MTEQTEDEEALRRANEELQLRAAALTRELGNANYALREKRRELDKLNASLETTVQDRTRELEETKEKLRQDEKLKQAFWTIE